MHEQMLQDVEDRRMVREFMERHICLKMEEVKKWFLLLIVF